MKEEQYTYYAFISYKREDERWARWVQKKLEFYHLPIELRSASEKNKGIKPIFRDKTDLGIGVLPDEIKKSLHSSKFLIVVCSQKSAHSKWVNAEIEYFIEIGRYDRIIPIIVDGIPHDKFRNCFPDVLADYWNSNPEDELLGVDVRELGKEKTIVHVVARILNVSFSSLWPHYKSYRRKKRLAISAIAFFIIALLYVFAIPTLLKIHLISEGKKLPFDGLLLKTINSEHQINSADTTLELVLPGYFKLLDYKVNIYGNYFCSQNDTVRLNYSWSTTLNIRLKRDNTFSVFSGVVYDGKRLPIGNAKVQVGNSIAYTDSNGYFYIEFPINKQSMTKSISIEKNGYKSFKRQEESPNDSLSYIIEKL